MVVCFEELVEDGQDSVAAITELTVEEVNDILKQQALLRKP